LLNLRRMILGPNFAEIVGSSRWTFPFLLGF
jgi:hypothetical protein